MKMYLISDNVDTYTGMRLAGVDGVVVHERDELKKALEDVLTDKTVGIVLLTEKFGESSLTLSTLFAWSGRCPFSWRFLTATEPEDRKISSPHTSLRRSD